MDDDVPLRPQPIHKFANFLDLGVRGNDIVIRTAVGNDDLRLSHAESGNVLHMPNHGK